MKSRLLRVTLALSGIALLSGCASNCNILSSSNSLGCDAMLMGGMILAAPIAAPAVLLSDAASDAKSKRMAREWKADMESRLADNDLEAIQECLEECNTAWKYQLDYDVRRGLQVDAARRFLTGNWQQGHAEDHTMYGVLAHHALSWKPESTEEDARSVLVPEHIRQSYTLWKDQNARAQLRKLLTSTRYNEIESTIYGMMFAIDTPADETAAQARFDQCSTIMNNIALDDKFFLHQSACSRAYSWHYRERVPEELRSQWYAAR